MSNVINFHKVELFLESTSGVPPVIFIQVIDLLYNAYTNRDFEYLKSKSLDVCIASAIVRNEATQKVSMKSTVAEVQKILFKEGGKCNR